MCEEEGLQIPSEETFSKEVRKKPRVTIVQKRIDGKKERVWSGIDLKKIDDVELASFTEENRSDESGAGGTGGTGISILRKNSECSKEDINEQKRACNKFLESKELPAPLAPPVPANPELSENESKESASNSAQDVFSRKISELFPLIKCEYCAKLGKNICFVTEEDLNLHVKAFHAQELVNPTETNSGTVPAKSKMSVGEVISAFHAKYPHGYAFTTIEFAQYVKSQGYAEEEAEKMLKILKEEGSVMEVSADVWRWT